MLALALLSLTSVAARRVGWQDVSLESPEASQRLADLRLVYTVANAGNRTETVGRANTPLDSGVYGDVFDVRDAAGNRMQYRGKIARRALVRDAAVLEVGRSVSNTVSLADAYALTSGDGQYTFTFGAVSATVTVTDVAAYTHPAGTGPHQMTTSSSVMACTSTETAGIKAAEEQSEVELKNSNDCLAAKSCDSEYTEWFGAETSSRYSTVTSTFKSIDDYLYSSRYNCDDCRNDRNVYAYVYPSDSTQTIYLCGAFWSLPEERANTIIHEVSHFRYVAATDDYAYGKSACRNLARTNPNNAIRNADNICYFSEAAPSQ